MKKDNVFSIDDEEKSKEFFFNLSRNFVELSDSISKKESLLFQKYSNIGPLVLLNIMAKRCEYSLAHNYQQNDFPDAYVATIEKIADMIFENLGLAMKPEKKIKPS